MFLDWKNQYCEKDHTTKAIYKFNVITIKSPMAIFHRIRKKIFNLYGNTKDLKFQSNLEKQKQIWGNQAIWLQTIL